MTSPVRYAVTAASGQLGRLAVKFLAERAGAENVVAIVRDPKRADGLFPAGVTVRRGDYDDPASLAAAFTDVDRLLLISSNAVGNRLTQHRNAIDAAKRAGVGRIAYTSILRADTSKLGLAEEHRETEALIAASGIPHTLLRNGWYTENYAASISPALQHHAFIGAARKGRISSAARIDYAEAAANALINDTAPRAVHELASDSAYTLEEFAAEISRQSGENVPYVDLPEAEFRKALTSAGLPDGFAALLADSDAGAADGALFDDTRTLSKLIGRPTTPFSATIAATLQAR